MLPLILPIGALLSGVALLLLGRAARCLHRFPHPDSGSPVGSWLSLRGFYTCQYLLSTYPNLLLSSVASSHLHVMRVI